MKLDPEFFDREDVAAISGEFGAIGELVVIRLLCENTQGRLLYMLGHHA